MKKSLICIYNSNMYNNMTLLFNNINQEFGYNAIFIKQNGKSTNPVYKLQDKDNKGKIIGYIKIFNSQPAYQIAIKSYEFLIKYNFNVPKILWKKESKNLSLFIMEEAKGISAIDYILNNKENEQNLQYIGEKIGKEIRKIADIKKNYKSKNKIGRDNFKFIKKSLGEELHNTLINSIKYLTYSHSDPNLYNFFIDKENITMIDFDVFRNSYDPIHSPAEDYCRFMGSCRISGFENNILLIDQVIEGFKIGYGNTSEIMRDEEINIISKFWDNLINKKFLLKNVIN